MTTQTCCADETTVGGALGAAPQPGDHGVAPSGVSHDFMLIEALTVAAIAESAEAVIEDLDAALVAAPALFDGRAVVDSEADAVSAGSESRDWMGFLVGTVWRNNDARPLIEGVAGSGIELHEGRVVAVDEYAKAVLYNGIGHYQAARAAAQRACERDDFVLLEGALAELVEASVRAGSYGGAVAAVRRLESRANLSGSGWAMGIAACSRALISDGDRAEGSYVEATERLGGTRARVALGRAHLLYGEWLRRRGRRVEARKQLTLAHRIFSEVGMDGFAERARRELLATGETARKRTDDTRFDLTPQEAQVTQLAASGCTNPEIGEQLFISPRTVEWHLGKVFTKLGVSSRRQLNGIFSTAAPVAASA